MTSLLTSLRIAAADLGEGLTPQQWAAPSLCEGWSCGDVIAHLAWGTTLPSPGFARDLLTARGRFHRAVADSARRMAERPQAEVCEILRSGATKQRIPDRLATPLVVDVLVHTQDVRRPLGIGHALDPALARRGLEYLVRFPQAVGGGSRLKGLELRATDTDWRHGSGRLVAGTAEQLLMVVAGRMSVVAELEGGGKSVLAGRS